MDNRAPHSGRTFWRLSLRSLQVRRPQALLAIGSLVVGASVCSLLLNLYGGVQRSMTQSFSSFGPNLVLAPRAMASSSSSLPSLMPEPGSDRLEEVAERFRGLSAVPTVYAVVGLNPAAANPGSESAHNVVAVGANLVDLWRMYPGWRLAPNPGAIGSSDCAIGSRVASKLQLRVGDEVALYRLGSVTDNGTAQFADCRVRTIVSAGSAEDYHVFVPLGLLQGLTGAEGEVSTVELRVPGTARQIERAIPIIRGIFPGTDVRPVRQIVYSAGKILGTISRLMLTLTALILIVIALCVVATMTAMIMERRKDIALMKALGASDRMVMEFFLTEAAALGLVAGLVGFGIGAIFARDLGLRLFQVALAPSGWVFPLVCLSSILLAVAAALFPVQMVRRVQPAVTLKGA
jgi:putative ABC transport system permease protein